ncbi:MAG: hypothetical protein U1E16_08420 [Hyphomicrobiales bacterium]
MTFEAAARHLYATIRPGWKNEKHAKQWIGTLEVHTFGKPGKRKVADLERRRNYVSLKVVKSKYGLSDDVYWFQNHSFDDVGLLEYVQLAPPPTSSDTAETLRKTIEGMVRTQPGACSRTAFRERYSGRSGKLGASKADVDRAIDGLLAEGKLIFRAPTDRELTAHGLGGRVKTVLDVKN